MLHPGGAGNAAPCCRPTKPIPTRLVVPILLLRRLPLYLGLMKALLPPADKALPTAVPTSGSALRLAPNALKPSLTALGPLHVAELALSAPDLQSGAEKLAKFSAGKKHARGRVAIFQFILSCCHDNRQRAGQA